MQEIDEEQRLNVVTDKLCITYKRIDTLSPYRGNARTHSKRQIRQIADSIRIFGFTNPVLIDQTNTIIAGHGRVQAAALLGLDRVPTICLDNLTPDQVRAYIIADNKLAENAGWDPAILKIEFQHLISVPDIDISVTGFEVAEIDLIIGASSITEDPDDQRPEEATRLVTQPGDLWCLGEHRVFCGSILEANSLESLMGDRKADMVFADPPYNIVIEDNVSGKGEVKHGDFAMACGEMNEVQFTQFLKDSFEALSRFSTDGSVHFICMDWRHMTEIQAAGDQIYDSLLNLCVWVKSNGGQGSFYRSQHELIFVFRNGKSQHRNNIQLGKFGRYRTNVWEYPAVCALPQRQDDEGNLLALHPTVKPVALVADAILDCSAPGELILDGFLGSGSTLIAAERVGRICYGLEIEPKYVDVAIRRWQRFTGERAYHAVTGALFDLQADQEGADEQPR